MERLPHETRIALGRDGLRCSCGAPIDLNAVREALLRPKPAMRAMAVGLAIVGTALWAFTESRAGIVVIAAAAICWATSHQQLIGLVSAVIHEARKRRRQHGP